MPRDDAYLMDIVIACGKAVSFLRGVRWEEFEHDELRQQAVIRMIEIIGEAARNLTQEFKDSHPKIPWRDIINMRHILTHMYWRVDVAKVWDTVQTDVPDLLARIEPLLPPASADPGYT
jgi:uncharacterized protein with HEPN domain